MIPNYDNCIWAVEPEGRQCEFCVFRDCRPRIKEEEEYNEPIIRADAYIEAMRQILGVDITKKCRKQEYVWGRDIVAYQLLKDGLHHREIARFLGIERSTVFHCVRSVEDMLKYYKTYPLQMDIWRRFQELSYLHKQ